MVARPACGAGNNEKGCSRKIDIDASREPYTNPKLKDSKTTIEFKSGGEQ
jgi:hypothetical protein